MTNYYKSKFYKQDIEVDNIDWEILVNITDDSWNKIIYSWYDIVDKTSYSPYISKCLLWSFIKEIPKNVLIIGFWGWAFAKYLEDYISEVNITWIEIDEAMIDIAKKEMWVKTTNFFNLDALESLEILSKKKNTKFDTIFIDVYDSNWKIPEYFSDITFFEKIKTILTSSWSLVINYADYSGDNIKLYDKIHNNLLSIFSNNYIHILNWKDDSGNISWVYNLDKGYSSEEVNLAYLEKVQNCEINYDSNLIKNIVLWK